MKSRNLIRHAIAGLTAGGCLFASGQSVAEVFTIQVKVTVVEKTCEIYGPREGQPVQVIFPDMIINQIDGISYGRTQINYNIKCEEDNPAIKIQFTGTDARNTNTSFAAGMLKTTENDMAIKILNGSQQLKLNDWLPFRYNSKPTLYAVAVPSNTGGISGGEFTASATLSVEYQ
ncbi:fimbrial protein [Providencia manganoxydans]|uniref:fimbrial protein n=1 Tax=Providencia TaxID=586 RepID=UPI00298EBF48|nr:fimbrial protein [Providencia sp. 2023EL-00965]MDW7587914.1 fimbrial protein [Providencia sp. 2023EL-00965]